MDRGGRACTRFESREPFLWPSRED
jgi:hypothetical protein